MPLMSVNCAKCNSAGSVNRLRAIACSIQLESALMSFFWTEVPMIDFRARNSTRSKINQFSELLSFI